MPKFIAIALFKRTQKPSRIFKFTAKFLFSTFVGGGNNWITCLWLNGPQVTFPLHLKMTPPKQTRPIVQRLREDSVNRRMTSQECKLHFMSGRDMRYHKTAAKKCKYLPVDKKMSENIHTHKEDFLVEIPFYTPLKIPV